MKGSNLLLFSGTKSSSGNTKTTGLKTGHRKDGSGFIKISAVSGTDPTLNVDIISYDEGTDDWYVVGSFDEFTATGKQRIYIPATDKELAIQYEITGTNTPTFTWKVSTILKD
ncbi:MAG: hypothetical protein KAV87_58170 [Desulfobacteraceae bacterium]|nr:hypothetical protein [Desulfobacteraceae bacterium]